MLLLAALTLALVQRIETDASLQPRTYVSPSGEWTLHVNPSERKGAGKSTVKISKQGVVKWTGEKPFTFRDAAIGDDGVSAGYGYLDGIWSHSGAFVVALLGADGNTLLVDETQRDGRSDMHAPPEPLANRIILQPERKIAIVSVDHPKGEDRDEGWWIYQLSPAKELDVVRPARVFEKPADHYSTFGFAAIRGTPLVLAQWDTWGEAPVRGGGDGSEFALYDEAWKLVWSLPLPGDLHIEEGTASWRLFEELHARSAILDTRIDRRFEVRHVASAQRVTYEVARDPSGATGWTVREVARAPYEVDVPVEAVALPILELGAAKTVELAVRFGIAPNPLQLSELGGSLFDGAGRCALWDRWSYAVQLFGPDASLEVTCIPALADFHNAYAIDAVVTAADGTIYVHPDHGGSEFIAFGADGVRIGPVDLGGNRIAFAPRTGGRWAASHDYLNGIRLRHFGADGELRFATDRRPDGDFFEDIRALACGPDDSVAVLDRGRGRHAHTGTLCFYSSTGEPQGQLPVTGFEMWFDDQLKFGGRWIAFSNGKSSACVVSAADGTCSVFKIPGADSRGYPWSISLAPDGSELWAMKHRGTVLHRFALPN